MSKVEVREEALLRTCQRPGVRAMRTAARAGAGTARRRSQPGRLRWSRWPKVKLDREKKRISIGGMKRLFCEKCEITAKPSWAFLWHPQTFELERPGGKPPRTIKRWLCPDCAGEFRSERAREAFLRQTLTRKA